MSVVGEALRPSAEAVQAIVRTALQEDVGRGDITTSLVVLPEATGTARIITRQPVVVAGLAVAAACFDELGAGAVSWEAACVDGDKLDSGAPLATVAGSLGPILTAERTALNLLAHMCAIATNAARFAALVDGTQARVVDTRKTTPGLRVLDKYAVRIGGCFNHRFGLDDGILIKENHVRAAGDVSRAVRRAAAGAPHGLKIEVEVENLDELDEALAARADAVLLDNMTPAGVATAVERAGGRVVLEASGGINEHNIREYASTGVDLISVGALTHSAPHVDLSLEVE